MNNNTMNITNDYTNFETVKDRIKIKLIGADSNLENRIHIPFLDMEITFVIPAPEIGEGAAVVVNEKLAEAWDKTAQELYIIALDNDTHNNPAHVDTMENMLKEIMGMDFVPVETPGGMYVASNEKKLHGASVILYPNFLRDFGKKIGESFWILPSSIHEVIFVPQSIGIEAKAFVDMVVDINKTVVSEEEILSDNVYLYDLDNDEIKIAA